MIRADLVTVAIASWGLLLLPNRKALARNNVDATKP